MAWWDPRDKEGPGSNEEKESILRRRRGGRGPGRTGWQGETEDDNSPGKGVLMKRALYDDEGDEEEDEGGKVGPKGTGRAVKKRRGVHDEEKHEIGRATEQELHIQEQRRDSSTPEHNQRKRKYTKMKKKYYLPTSPHTFRRNNIPLLGNAGNFQTRTYPKRHIIRIKFEIWLEGISIRDISKYSIRIFEVCRKTAYYCIHHYNLY